MLGLAHSPSMLLPCWGTGFGAPACLHRNLAGPPRTLLGLSTHPYCSHHGADVDHDYWGRPEQQEAWLKSRNSLPRKAYIWNRTMAASDLLGMVRNWGGGAELGVFEA